MKKTFNLAVASLSFMAASLFMGNEPVMAQDTLTTSSIKASSLTEEKLANNLYFGHVKSRDPITNLNAGRGMYHLTAEVRDKTAIRPNGYVSIDMERDDISFFPFLYWPVTDREATLTDAAQRKLQEYINKGGMIIFDIQSEAAERNGTLKRMLGNVNIGALEKADAKHTLNRSFYLFSKPEDHYYKGDVWVEQKEFDNPEAVTSVVIARANWAQAWAGISAAPGTKLHERALREGVNVVLHAMTGNYKQDLDHNRAVLEKMDLRKK